MVVTALADEPGMNLLWKSYSISIHASALDKMQSHRARWRWKLSREVDPWAHLCVGSETPPFTSLAVSVYKWIEGGSWRHLTWYLCSCQMFFFISSLKNGIPKASVAAERARSKESIASNVSSVPRVQRRQCLRSYCLHSAFYTAEVDEFRTPSATNSPL